MAAKRAKKPDAVVCPTRVEPQPAKFGPVGALDDRPRSPALVEAAGDGKIVSAALTFADAAGMNDLRLTFPAG